jgi:Transmembrane family 220, helix
MKILNGILALMFLSFAWLQVNDPDPILWILIYGAMVAVCVMAFLKIYKPYLMSALALGYSVYMVILFPGVKAWFHSENLSLLWDDLAKMQYWYIEEAREFLGLMICLSVLVFYSIPLIRKK